MCRPSGLHIAFLEGGLHDLEDLSGDGEELVGEAYDVT